MEKCRAFTKKSVLCFLGSENLKNSVSIKNIELQINILTKTNVSEKKFCHFVFKSVKISSDLVLFLYECL